MTALSSIISTSDKTPGAFLKVSLGVGAQSAAAAPIKVLVAGNKTSAGSKAAASISLVSSPDDAVAYYGQGSELHRMIRNVLRAYKGATVYGGIIAESAGTAASTTIVFSGTATAAGTVEVYVCGERVVASFASGDTATTVGAAVATAINNNGDLPVTAANVSGTVTVTAKHKGPRGNRIRVYNTITSGHGYTHTPTDAYLSSGATSDSPSNLLDAAAASRYHVVVAPYDDATNVGSFKAAIAASADPLEGKRGVYVFASQDTLANAITLVTTINDARGRGLWHYNSDVPPAELAASWAGTYAAGLEKDAATNYDGVQVLAAKAQRTATDRPIASEITSALNNGITPIKVLADESTCVVVRAITTRSKDSGGLPDYRTLDVHQVDAIDAVADQLASDWVAFAASNPKLGSDPDDATSMPAPGIATEKTIKDWAYGILKRFDAEDAEGSAGSLGRYLVDVEVNAANLVVEADAIAEGRVNLSIPCDAVKLLHQAAIDVRQIG